MEGLCSCALSDPPSCHSMLIAICLCTKSVAHSCWHKRNWSWQQKHAKLGRRHISRQDNRTELNITTEAYKAGQQTHTRRNNRTQLTMTTEAIHSWPPYTCKGGNRTKLNLTTVPVQCTTQQCTHQWQTTNCLCGCNSATVTRHPV